MEKKKRGGPRPGSGRKKIDNKRIKRSFSLRPGTSQALDVAIAAYDRSEFIDSLIRQRLDVDTGEEKWFEKFLD